MDKEKLSIEEMFKKLEETVASLEKEDVTLEESFKLYEEGMKLVAACDQEIDLVEKKVLELNERGNTSEFH